MAGGSSGCSLFPTLYSIVVSSTLVVTAPAEAGDTDINKRLIAEPQQSTPVGVGFGVNCLQGPLSWDWSSANGLHQQLV